MKDDIHPKYQQVLFVDSSTGFRFLCGSTLHPKESEEFEGKTYPVIKVSISSASHPFFTKKNQFVDAAGRIDRFNERYKTKAVKVPEVAAEETTETKVAPKKKAGPKK